MLADSQKPIRTCRVSEGAVRILRKDVTVWDLQLLVKVGRGFTSPVSNPKRFVKVGRGLGDLGSVTLRFHELLQGADFACKTSSCLMHLLNFHLASQTFEGCRLRFKNLYWRVQPLLAIHKVI